MEDYVFMYVAHLYTAKNLGDEKLSYLLKINIAWSKQLSLHIDTL